MKIVETEILVIGGGGAGMSAAAAASENGARVSIVDDNPGYGGQIWRRGIEEEGSGKALGLIERLDNKGAKLLSGTTVIDRLGTSALLASGPEGATELRYAKLVIATGARERFLPFPGWTLPNVFGAGGLQALVKSGFSVDGKRIIVAGTGPLLLAVAEYLKNEGANVLFVAEQAGYRPLAGLALRLIGFPSKLGQALSFRIKPGTVVALKTGAFVAEAKGKEKLESVLISQGGRIREYECDLLAAGFHLVPNLELPLLFGCMADDDGITVNEFQETTVNNIFAAGETTGIGGIELSCVEGEIAGLASVGLEKEARRLFRKRDRYGRFAAHLNNTFELRREIREAVCADTIVCRCEDVTVDSLKDYENWRDAKLQTRCGMGPCQGRVCGPAANYLFGWETFGVRPPIFPVELKDLVSGSLSD